MPSRAAWSAVPDGNNGKHIEFRETERVLPVFPCQAPGQMKCPQCHSTPIGFVAFLLIGWIHIRCRSCSTRLLIESIGSGFWNILSAGIIVLAGIWFFPDYPHRLLGPDLTLFVFVAIAFLTVVLSVFLGWKNARLAIRAQHHKTE